MKYSQKNEEEWILGCCPEQGRFLDIGAFDPRNFSNTRALYEKGWSGVMIEPAPGPFNALLREYGNEPRITLVCAAVGPDRQLVNMHATEDGVSTTDEQWFTKWSKEGGYYGSFLTSQITLDEIFLRFTGNFQFVNIDTEGSSFEILKTLLATGVRPHCICFEHDNRFAESFATFDLAGYKLLYENDENRVVVLK